MKVKQRGVFQFSSKPNLQYCVLLCAVCFGGTGKRKERNARLCERKKKALKKNGRQSFLGNSRKMHPASPSFQLSPWHARITGILRHTKRSWWLLAISRKVFRCASISSSDDRDSLTDSLADWKLTVL